MTTKNPKGKSYKVIVGDAYWLKDGPVEAGTKITLTKQEAAKLLHRGIVEEA